MLTIFRHGGAGYFYTALAINIARLTARLLRQSRFGFDPRSLSDTRLA